MPDALETLISSRVRRTLIEHLLSHPKDRFYLRGLAKELGLSVSPLRRELKRLEQAGALKAMPEGNILFYEANPDAPVFQRVRQAAQPAASMPAPQPAREPVAASPQPVMQPAAPQPMAVTVRPAVGFAPLARLMVIAAGGALAFALLVGAGLAYVSVKKPQAVSRVIRALEGRPNAAMVAPATSGMMRGGRWRLVPGGFGGFGGTAPSSEAY